MRKILILLILTAVTILSGCTYRSVMHADMTDLSRHDNVSGGGEGSGKIAVSELIVEKTGDIESADSGKPDSNRANNLTRSKHETVNNFEGVSMTVKEGTLSSAGLVLIFENNSGKECIYGDYFLLEQKINDIWYVTPVTIEGDYGFDSIGYMLEPGKKREQEINWQWLHGSLNNGEYRIIKDISDFRATGDYDVYYLAAEFQVV